MMGEAKRRAQTEYASKELISKLQSLSISPASTLDCVQMVVIDLQHIANARNVIGKLPALLERYVLDAGASDEVSGVFWAAWPSGRQEAQLLRSTEEFRDHLQGEYLNVAARGFSLSVTAFPDYGWKQALQAVHDEIEPMAIEAHKAMSNSNGVELIHTNNGQSLIAIPEMQDDLQFDGVSVRVLRILDELVASETALKKNRASLGFSFDGLNDDPREVWDIEPCKKLLRFIDTCAPWWMWLTQPNQFIVWLGALVSTGSAVVNASMQVAYPLDMGAATSLRRKGAEACLDVALAAGMDVSSKFTQETIAQAINYFNQSVKLTSQRMMEIEAGKVEKASESAVRSFHIHHPGGSEIGGTLGPYTLVIDRSDLGCAELDRMMEGPRRVPSTAMRAALLNWKESGSPIAVIRAGVQSDTDWSITPVDHDANKLRPLIEDLVGESIEAKVSFAWSLAVDGPTKHQLETLAKAVTLDLLANIGMHAFNSAEEAAEQVNHSGLLKLAIEPGGSEVNFDNVQITDPDVFGKIASLGMDDLLKTVANINAGNAAVTDLDAADIGIRAWRRDDGSLLVRETSQAPKEVIAPAGSWRLLDDQELARVTREATRKMKDVDGDVLQSLADSFNSGVEKARQRAKTRDVLKDKATSVAAIFGRETQSLLFMQTFLAGRVDAVEQVDLWLAGTDAYFILWRHRQGLAACLNVVDEEMLLSDALASVLDMGEAPDTTLLLPATRTAVDAKALAWWKGRGALTQE
jgi:hypothetical protein